MREVTLPLAFPLTVTLSMVDANRSQMPYVSQSREVSRKMEYRPAHCTGLARITLAPRQLSLSGVVLLQACGISYGLPAASGLQHELGEGASRVTR